MKITFIMILLWTFIFVLANFTQTSGCEYCDKEISYCDAMENPKFPDDLNAKDSCYSTVAEIKKDAKICDKIIEPSTSAICYNNLGRLLNDQKICEKITSEKWIYLRDMCYASVSIGTNNEFLCEKIIANGQKDVCYESVGKSKKSASICDKIEEGNSRDRCFLDINKADPRLENIESEKAESPKLFSKIANFFKKIFTSESKASKIPECENIAVPAEYAEYAEYAVEYRKATRASCYTNHAEKSKNPILCKENIPDKYDQDACLIKVAVAKGDDSLCNEIVTQPNKDECYSQIASITNKLETCEKIKRYQDKSNRCIAKIATSLKNESICNKMQDIDLDKSYTRSCLFGVALAKNDESICTKIGKESHDSLLINCYTQIAKSGKINSCNNVVEDLRDWCYFDAAKATQNKEACSRIVKENMKQSCYESIQ